AEAENVLGKILDAAREAVLVIDGKLVIVAANIAAQKAFSRPGLSLEESSLADVIYDTAISAAAANACAAGEASDIHLKYGPKGNRRRYDVHIAPLELEGERNAIGFFNDVTQVHRLENIRQEFLSNISHELRTPLTS